MDSIGLKQSILCYWVSGKHFIFQHQDKDRYIFNEIQTVHGVKTLNVINPYQFFSCNFYKRRN